MTCNTDKPTVMCLIDAEYDGTERSVRLTGLFSSTRYAIQVRAHNEEGTSESV